MRVPQPPDQSSNGENPEGVTPGGFDFGFYWIPAFAGMTLLYLSALDTDPHHPAPAYRLQLGDADFGPRGLEVVEQDLGDAFGQRFEQVEMAGGKFGLDAAHDVGVVERILDVVGCAGAAVGQGDVEVDLQGLRHLLFPFVDADEGFDLEFAQKDDVHEFSSFGC